MWKPLLQGTRKVSQSYKIALPCLELLSSRQLAQRRPVLPAALFSTTWSRPCLEVLIQKSSNLTT